MEQSALKTIILYAAVLTLVCAIAAVALGGIFAFAKPEIDKNEKAEILKGLNTLLEPAENRLAQDQKTKLDERLNEIEGKFTELSRVIEESIKDNTIEIDILKTIIKNTDKKIQTCFETGLDKLLKEKETYIKKANLNVLLNTVEEGIKRDKIVEFLEENEIVFLVISKDKISYWETLTKAGVSGYVASGEALGYSSTIKVLVRTDIDQKKIIRIKVTSSQETPGLGERIKEIKSSNTLVTMLMGKSKDESHLRPFYQDRFNDLETKNTNSVETISGATISSKATIAAVNDALKSLEKALRGTK